jgi:DNA-binding GntR family transcriptional regulator
VARVSTTVASQLGTAPAAALVADHIRRAIVEGRLRPGDKIGQDAVAQELGMSRIPVREALIQMERDGLVQNKPNVGAFVAEFDEELVLDHFDVLASVQALAAERVARRGDRGIARRLREISDSVQREDDPKAVNDLALEFHRIVNLASGSPRLQSVLRSLSRVLPVDIFTYVPSAVAAQRTGIAAMTDAIESGSASRIRKAFYDVNHLRAEMIIDDLRRRGTFL